MNGIFLLNKARGMTSFQSLGMVKKKLGTKKVGHTGTLDKFAHGLMVVVSGSFTKLAPYFSGLDKVYEAEICFGKETSTLDPEGELVAEAAIPDLERIKSELEYFEGDIKQRPPCFSAVHIDGKRAYQRTLSGEKVVMPERDISIYSLEILSYKAPFLMLRVHCSKGTYIRSLARDLGIASGSRAYLTALERIKVGPFHVEKAVSGENIDTKSALSLKDVFYQLKEISLLTVDHFLEEKIKNGVPLRCNQLNLDNVINEKIAVFSENGEMLCMLKYIDSRISYHFVINQES